MAKQTNRKLISRERTDTIGFENDGQEAFRFGFESRDYEEGDAMSTEKDAENLVCTDGTVVNASQIINAGKYGILKRCDICQEESQRSLFRRPTPRFNYSLAVNMRTCYSCSKSMCLKHFAVSSIDGRLRCKKCDSRHFWYDFWFNKILKRILFK
jgi:hypothetical protein